MTAYIDVQYIKANGSFTPTAVDQLVSDLGDITPIVEGRGAYIDSRLYKRYQAPFETPYPEAVRQWCCALVCEILLIRRGGNVGSELSDAVKAEADTARAELKEAASGETGLFDIPMRQLTPADASGIEHGGPLGYSENSPYTFLDAETGYVR